MKKNHLQSVFYTWSIYFTLITIAITIAPYNFKLQNMGEFSWKINAFDMLENLFLLFPISFCFTLSQTTSFKFSSIIKLTLLGFMLSFFVESMQLFLEVRTSQYWDLIANTLSMTLGIITALVCKPLIGKISINSLAISKLLHALFAITILLLIRVMTNYQHFALLESNLLLCACGILILIFSHYSMKKKYTLINQTTIATIIFAIVSLFPLLISNIRLFLLLTLLCSLVTPLSVYLMMKSHGLSSLSKKNMLLLLSYLPIMIALSFMISDNVTMDSAGPFFLLDNLVVQYNARIVGNFVIQAFLFFITTYQLLAYFIYSNNK
jgi:glycopeptide antibiotics resistance protein